MSTPHMQLSIVLRPEDWVCRNFGHDPRPRPDDPVCRDCGTNLEETMA